MSGQRKTARVADNSELTGRFRRWWQVVDSNHRRRSRRFYSPSLLAEAYAPDQRVLRSRWDFGPPPSAMRPCVPGPGAVERTDGHGRRGQERCPDRMQERYADRPASPTAR